MEDGWERGGKMGPPGRGCSLGEGWEGPAHGGDENPRASSVEGCAGGLGCLPSVLPAPFPAPEGLGVQSCPETQAPAAWDSLPCQLVFNS